MNKFKPLKARFRATFAAGGVNERRLGSVDRENRVLHDVQITLEGEAKGHGVWLDRAFCEDVAKAGNEMGEAGVKVRFGHPGMCSDALGTYLGRATNFRVVDLTRKESGETAAGVIADIALDEHADRTEWVLNMSESAPDTFGQSIVFTYGDLKVKDADGNEHSYQEECVDGVEDPDSKSGKRTCKTNKSWMEQSADGKVYVVLGKLHGTDFTDTPAATDGVFSDNSLAAEAEQMLDEHPEVLAVIEQHPEKVYEFCARIGILDKLESKRVSGLQAEKDREIESLRKIVAERDALLKGTVDKSKADFERLGAERQAVQEELTLAKKNLKESEEALAAANGRVEQLSAELKANEKALAEAREQLDREQVRYRELTGKALRPAEQLKTAGQIACDASLSPAERVRLLTSGNYSK